MKISAQELYELISIVKEDTAEAQANTNISREVSLMRERDEAIDRATRAESGDLVWRDSLQGEYDRLQQRFDALGEEYKSMVQDRNQYQERLNRLKGVDNQSA